MARRAALPRTSPLAPSGGVRLIARGWRDYELLDTGAGAKLERYGSYVIARPEAQATWAPALPRRVWEAAHAVFHPAARAGRREAAAESKEAANASALLAAAGGAEEKAVPSGAEGQAGWWERRRPLPDRWPMAYGPLRFWVRLTPFRHLGVFPEQAPHWDWMQRQIRRVLSREAEPPRVLALFAYTGLGTLASAAAGARVTHVDSSRKAVAWARENQALSGLSERPVRWIVDDALKFVAREARRGARYEGLVLDPPPFGRGPRGERWRVERSLPLLLDQCRALLADQPCFIVLTTYAARLGPEALQAALEPLVAGYGGRVEAGTLALLERSAGRMVVPACFARWRAAL